MLIFDVIMCMDFQYLGTILLLSQTFLLSIRKILSFFKVIFLYNSWSKTRFINLCFREFHLSCPFLHSPYSGHLQSAVVEIGCTVPDHLPTWASLCPSPCSLSGLVISTLSCCFLLLTYWVIPAAGFLLIMPSWFSLFNVSFSPYTNIFHTCTHLGVPILKWVFLWITFLKVCWTYLNGLSCLLHITILSAINL